MPYGIAFESLMQLPRVRIETGISRSTWNPG
jgi:hypothetical protein